MKVKSSFMNDFSVNDFSEVTRISSKEIKYGNHNQSDFSGKSKDKEKKKDYSEERKRKRGE